MAPGKYSSWRVRGRQHGGTCAGPAGADPMPAALNSCAIGPGVRAVGACLPACRAERRVDAAASHVGRRGSRPRL